MGTVVKQIFGNKAEGLFLITKVKKRTHLIAVEEKASIYKHFQDWGKNYGGFNPPGNRVQKADQRAAYQRL